MKQVFLLSLLTLVTLTLSAQEVPYRSGKDSWDPDSLGNHRAVVAFRGTGKIAHVILPWRRHDANVTQKRIIVQDSATGKKILNVCTGGINQESGEVFFEPASGKGLYYVYYMPYKNEGRSNYPRGTYLSPEKTADAHWLAALPATAPVNTQVKLFESVNAFNSFYPMEVTATKAETDALLAKHTSSSFLVFPEDRQYPIRMKQYLPYRWIKQGEVHQFKGAAARGEHYYYQLGVYARESLTGVQVVFSDLTNSQGGKIGTSHLSCLNTGGTDYTGHPFSKQVKVAAGEVQALWCGVEVPEGCTPGIYTGKAVVSAEGAAPVTVTVQLSVSATVLKDGGISNPALQTRLKWLNSTLAQDNTVISPYVPLQVEDHTISLLGRQVTLGEAGFPERISTFFTPEMTGYQEMPNEVLSSPIHFEVKDASGKLVKWQEGPVQFTQQTAGTVAWKAASKSSFLAMDVNARVEFDGFMFYEVKLNAQEDIDLQEVAMQIPYHPKAAAYMMGLGEKGGLRKPDFSWKWDVANKNQDGAWIGSVNAGLQYSLRDERYTRPLNTNFYLQKPLLLPHSWGNEGKGGISIKEEGRSTIATNYSGARHMKKGETLYYNFVMLITPFHTLKTDFQWANRFYHKYEHIDSIRKEGANLINIHHATPINPWINYPFIEYAKMKAYIDEAHRKGMRVKIYNTVRELSNRAWELPALRSLGDEIYSPGKGNGFSWLQEHVGDNYIAAWFVPEIKDAAIINSGMNRWHNYYVEGMNWLVQHAGIDGIYLDDVAFDRVTMKRIKRVLTKDGHPGIIDLHSANQYNKSDGFNNSAMLYMEHFPYLDRLWFGEYFDYEKNTPDFYLTEVSGIPFGLMGEMLQDGGNPWRGMIYGMTNRYPWSKEADPRYIWQLWDAFGMQGSKMIGYWSGRCPVKADDEKVLATVYQQEHKVLVAIASWADRDTTVHLSIDWKALGIDPAKARISASAVKNFQPERQFTPTEAIPVAKGKGWLLEISEKK